MLQSCSSGGSDNSNTNSISSPFIVKYEVITTSNVYSSFGTPRIAYVNSTGQQQTESVSNLTPSNPWIKTVTVTATTRPLQLNLLLSTLPPDVYRLWLSNAGSITQNIYVNGTLVASSTNQSVTTDNGFGEYNINIIALDYAIL